MLDPYRVLDLTDDRGQLAAEILCLLGADVVLVEPPGGSPGRSIAPFAGDEPGPERSLTFWGRNRGKRSVVLDLTAADGRQQLDRLAADADVLIENGVAPVDLDRLREDNPHLVTVSISPFGPTGPKADWPVTDLTLLAAGGQLVLTGDSDRAPVRTSEPQAFLHAAGDAACGALFALAERARSGLGQHVDVSVQRSVLFATQSHMLSTALRSPLTSRVSGGLRIGAIDVQLVWPCKDGFVSITFLFGPSFGPYTQRLMEWMREEGHCDDETCRTDWVGYAERLFGGTELHGEYEQLKKLVDRFCRTKTKEELLDAAVRRRLLIAPIANAEDVVTSSQFAARDYFDRVPDEVLSSSPVVAPGAYVQPSGAKLAVLPRAPRVGEHTEEVLAATRRDNGRPRGDGARHLPLEGLNVVDLTWALTGPATARSLSDYGATVVHVESAKRVDAARTVPPYVDDVAAPEHAAVYLNMNVGKLGVSLDLSGPEGRAVLDDLVRWADVVIESFSPRGRISLGLDYERLRELNPRLIMFSSCLFGQYGPLEPYAGFGTSGAALSGFFDLTGWPDRAPCGPFSAYTDYVSPRFAIPALLAAVDHRRRTGEGQYLDFAQAESAVHFLTPTVLDYTVNGRLGTRAGNRDPFMAPHGVYPCAGEDRWVAVACRDDRDWRELAAVLDRADLAPLDTAERLRRADELDELVSAWTRERAPRDVEAVLIPRGVPAHGVQHSPECATDPQLLHEGHFVEVDHAQHGRVTIESSRTTLSATPAVIQRGPALLGQHTVEVLTDLLGYDDARIGRLRACGVLD